MLLIVAIRFLILEFAAMVPRDNLDMRGLEVVHERMKIGESGAAACVIAALIDGDKRSRKEE